jgi:hypothetical protein
MGILPRRDNPAHRVSVCVGQQSADGKVYTVSRAQGRSGAQLYQHAGAVILILSQPIQGVSEDREVGGVIPGQFHGTQERRLCTPLAGHRRDLLVVGANDDSPHRGGLPGCSDAPRDQRESVERADVLSRDAFGASASGN